MLNILFMGTPDFARDSLEAVYNAGHNILGVVTNPDRPKGRGMKMIPSPVKEFALEKELKITTASAGVNIVSEENLNINIIAPNKEYNDLNNSSAVVKIIYGNIKFLFMGDAETKSENDITSDVSADVIKIGHHGSNTSSGQSFVNRVNPKYAIIMVGQNNQYKHPNQSIIDRWINSGAKVYRTDINGNIIVLSNGDSLDIKSTVISLINIPVCL